MVLENLAVAGLAININRALGIKENVMSVLYVVRAGECNRFKVGVTKKGIRSQIATLQTRCTDVLTSFWSLEADKCQPLESVIHVRLAAHRSDNGWFDVSEKDMSEAIDLARRAFDERKKWHDEANAYWESSETTGCVLVADPEALQLRDELRDIQNQIGRLQYRGDTIRDRLRAMIGNNDEIGGIATWKVESQRRFDSATFRTDQPELYQKYLVVRNSRALRMRS